MSTIFALVKNKSLPNHRISTRKPNGSHSAVCEHCQTPVNYEDDENQGETVVAIACSQECLDAIQGNYIRNEPKTMPAAAIADEDGEPVIATTEAASKKAKFCPECNGASSRGRGWNHIPTCSLSSRNKNKPVNADVCATCNGPRRGRGHAHNEGCAALAKMRADNLAKIKAKSGQSTELRFCEECKGPARGRGYSHVEGCTVSFKAAFKAAKE